jgi:hypothetical protein
MAEKMYQGKGFDCYKGSLKGSVAAGIIVGLFLVELAYFLAVFMTE